MYIICDTIKSKDNLKVISHRQFMELYVTKFTKGLMKNTDESDHSHLYYISTDNNVSISCRF